MAIGKKARNPLFARALGRSSRDPITTWLAAGAALRGLVREVVVFHEENELQDAALSAGAYLFPTAAADSRCLPARNHDCFSFGLRR